MKKRITLFYLIVFIGVLVTSCGPSAKEHESKRVADSTRLADSLAMVQARLQRNADSITKNGSNINELNLSTKTPKDKKFIKTAETKFLVKNVRRASEILEDLAAKYSGYVTYTNLRNTERDFSEIRISRDSILRSKIIIVENQINLRIPNENLDSLVRELNKLILFLDYRIVKMDDISFNILANQKAIERLKTYDTRQKQHIDKKASKLKETTSAEESVLNRQQQSDNLQLESLALEDQVKYCTLTIYIYQKPIYYNETQVYPNIDLYRPNLGTRIISALVNGWIIFEDIVVFLFNIWWLIVIIIGGLVVFRFWRKRRRKQ
jgi:hypothetical protein